MACPEQSRYPKQWLSSLSDARKALFHAFAFDQWPENRYV